MSVQSVAGMAGQQSQSGADQQPEDQIRQDSGTQSLAEMIREAQEKAAAQRDALTVPKSSRYGDAPLEAYARLARAKSKSQVNQASGFARRKIMQLRGSLRTDSDNKIRIKGAISQLEKAITRGERKKKELDRERLAELRKARSEEQRKREEQELRRSRAQRMIRESGYLREAQVSDRLATQLTATQMELRQQAQQTFSGIAASAETAAQQYTATASAAAGAEAAAPAGGLSCAG